MSSNLLKVRKAAGYRSSKSFAERVCLPPSSYARYESNPDRIPIQVAWRIADELGITIDEVVGRRPTRPADLRGEFQKDFDDLPPADRDLIARVMRAVKSSRRDVAEP